jgi:hypothetical protein
MKSETKTLSCHQLGKAKQRLSCFNFSFQAKLKLFKNFRNAAASGGAKGFTQLI